MPHPGKRCFISRYRNRADLPNGFDASGGQTDSQSPELTITETGHSGNGILARGQLTDRLACWLASKLACLQVGLPHGRELFLSGHSNGRMAGVMIVAMVNSKGGVGKSTLAGSLVGWLHAHGHRVILADCDTQQSSSEWIREALPDVPVVQLTCADEVFDELPILARDAEFIVADGPGSQTETSRALLMFADLAVLPCKASMFEARALDKNTAFVRHAQSIRQGPPPAVAVLSMVGRDYRLTKDMLDAAQSLEIAVAGTAVTLRQAYADAPGQATFVWNMGYSARDAADEIDSLFRELLPQAINADVALLRKVRRQMRVVGDRGHE